MVAVVLGMSRFVHKSHNVSVLLYHFVCPTKYRRSVFSQEVDAALVSVCQEIANRYEIEFIEIGVDRNHVHFLVQSVPTYSPTKIVRVVKSITGRQLLAQMPELKKALWGGELWSNGYFVNTVGRFGSESGTQRYIAEQGIKSYQVLHRGQMSLFEQTEDDT